MACQHCEDSTGFTRWEAQDKLILSFEKLRPAKFGDLVTCPGCGSVYLLVQEVENPGHVEMARIEKDEMPVFDAWNSRPLYPTVEQLAVLQAIGATPPDVFTNGSGQIIVPCRCTLNDGKELDYCLVRLQKLPPLKSNLYDARFIFLDEVKEIFPSGFALSGAVRYATTRAEELSMSFAPTVVLGPDQKTYYFNWTNNFVAHADWQGNDISLPKQPSVDAYSTEGGHLQFDQVVTYIMGDWRDEYTALRITG